MVQNAFKTEDGKYFDDLELAKQHETKRKFDAEERFKQYTTVSYAGRQLLAKHSLDEFGIWEVRGEDPNCDMGGHHHNPYLGTYQGRLRTVLKKAVQIPGWSQWGGAGVIKKLDIEVLEHQ